jgi:hypothetical protein
LIWINVVYYDPRLLGLLLHEAKTKCRCVMAFRCRATDNRNERSNCGNPEAPSEGVPRRCLSSPGGFRPARGPIGSCASNTYSFTTIDVPGASSAETNGINDSGQIGGSYDDVADIKLIKPARHFDFRGFFSHRLNRREQLLSLTKQFYNGDAVDTWKCRRGAGRNTRC